MEYTAGKGTTALGVVGTVLGSIGTAAATGVLGGNGLNLFGNNSACACNENMPVTRYELAQEQKISKLESELALRDSTIYSDKKSLELYQYIDGRMRNIESQLATQAVHNATSDAVIGCMQGQIAQLMGLTKLVVPNTSVCPGWGNVTVTPATTATT